MICRSLLVLLVSGLLVPCGSAQSPVKPRLDWLGDPLPDGAIARLGTLRLKHGPFGCMPFYAGAIVDDVVFSPDGKTFASLDVENSGTLRLWDRATGKEIRGPWNAADFRYTGVAFSPDGVMLAGAGFRLGARPSQGEVRLFDIARSTLVKGLGNESRLVETLVFADGGKTLVLAGNGVVSWWDLPTGKEKRSWKPFADNTQPGPGGAAILSFNQPVLAPDARSIAVQVQWTRPGFGKRQGSESMEHEAYGFDLATGKMTWRATGTYGGDQRSHFAYSADGKCVAIALGPDRVEVRNAHSGKLISSPLNRSHTRCFWVGGLALSSDGKATALVGDTSKVVRWSTDDPRTLRMAVARGGPNSGHCVQFSPDNKTLLVGVHVDLQLYDADTLREILPWGGHRRAIDLVSFTQDGKRVLTGSAMIDDLQPREVAAWDVATWKELQRTSFHIPRWPNQGNVSPDLSVYTGKDSTDRLALYDLKSGKLLTRLHVPSSGPRGNPPGAEPGFFSPGGKHYVLDRFDQGAKGALGLYAIPSGKLRCLLPAIPRLVVGNDAARPIVFSRDERLVALFAREDAKIYIYDTDTGRVRQRLGPSWAPDQRLPNEQHYFTGNLAFSPDSKLLASWIVTEKVIRVWEVATGTEHQAIVLEEQPDDSRRHPLLRRPHFAWSHDNRVLAVSENKIQLWELATRRVRHEWAGHEGAPIRALAYAPGGRFLASGSVDTTVLIWDMALLDRAVPFPVARGPGDLATRWQVLAEADAVKAFAAIRELSVAPLESVAWIEEHVKPTAAFTAKQMEDLIGQLDDGRFRMREKATADLVELGDQALPAIDRALAGNPALETRRRLEGVRKRVSMAVLTGASLQAYRAVEVLERIGTPQARQVLQTLSAGGEGALVTAQARAALARMRE